MLPSQIEWRFWKYFHHFLIPIKFLLQLKGFWYTHKVLCNDLKFRKIFMIKLIWWFCMGQSMPEIILSEAIQVILLTETSFPYVRTGCDSEMRLATLCTNRQSCCLLLHTTVRLNCAVDLVSGWTYCTSYMNVESVCVCELRYENWPATLWHKSLCKTWRNSYYD